MAPSMKDCTSKPLPHKLWLKIAPSVMRMQKLMSRLHRRLWDSVSLALKILLTESTSSLITFHLFTTPFSTFLQAPHPPVVYLERLRNVTFIDCNFHSNLGSAIKVYDSKFLLLGNVSFINNSAYEGGALNFIGESYAFISSNANIVFQNNSAEHVGGAIFVNNIGPVKSCFFQIEAIAIISPSCCFPSVSRSCIPSVIVNITFINNTGWKGGDTIYGAFLDSCNMLVCFSGWNVIKSSALQLV